MYKLENKFVVIGGGPAGIQAALTLHRWGLNVCVLSRPLPDCPMAQIPIFDENQRPFVDIARANIKEFREKKIQNLIVNVTAVTENESKRGFIVEYPNYIIKATHVIIATGTPKREDGIDFTGCPELTFDRENRIIIDDNYSSEQHQLYAIGEAASGYVRNLSCALGTGDGLARMLARTQHHNKPA
jgi:thioredoxin reductase